MELKIVRMVSMKLNAIISDIYRFLNAMRTEKLFLGVTFVILCPIVKMEKMKNIAVKRKFFWNFKKTNNKIN